MVAEIERRFLPATRDLSFLEGIEGIPIVQGYLHNEGMTSRVRIAGDNAFLTFKGKSQGKKLKVKNKSKSKAVKCRAKPEFEYPIPMDDALELIEEHTIGKLVIKTRYPVPVGEHIWEVDVFHGHLQGLVICEVELTSLKEEFEVPAWAGMEITGIKQYSNRNLSREDRAPLILLAQAA
jgi:adenylate cyclase